MNTRLLDILSDGRFHSGDSLGAAIGLTRGAVWKQLERLERETGLQVQRVRGKGYRLEAPISLLDRALLEKAATELGYGIYLLPEVDSTSSEALRLLQARQAVAPFVVLAESQTRGRGRRGRTWQSPVAENLYLSIAYPVTGGLAQLQGASLCVGLAVLDALGPLELADVGLKWPNDILVDGRKLGGVLLELVGDPQDICHVVIGIGLNVNSRLLDAVQQPWTSLYRVLGQRIDRSELALCLMRSLARYWGVQQREGFGALREEWEAAHLWQGRRCVLSSEGGRAVEGVVLGVTNDGSLRLDLAQAGEQAFCAGELSLRLADDS